MSVLDNDCTMRQAYHENCGGTILVGNPGTPEEHRYCDRCDYMVYLDDESKSEDD